MTDSHEPRPPTICKCGSAKDYHRPQDHRDHAYEPMYEPTAWREGYRAAEARSSSSDVSADLRDALANALRDLTERTPGYLAAVDQENTPTALRNLADAILNDAGVRAAVEDRVRAATPASPETPRGEDLRTVALKFLRNWHLVARPDHPHDLVDDCDEPLFVRMREVLAAASPPDTGAGIDAATLAKAFETLHLSVTIGPEGAYYRDMEDCIRAALAEAGGPSRG